MTAGIQSREIGSDRVRSIAGESINHHQRQVNSGITLPNELWQLRESGERDIREVREIRIYIYIYIRRIEFIYSKREDSRYL